MAKTRKPVVAGVLDIVSAVMCLWFLLGLSLEGTVFWAVFPKDLFGLNNPSTVYLIITLPLVGMAILALIGGTFALRRKKWGVALAGSIAAILPCLPLALAETGFIAFGLLGVAAIILVVKAKTEFTRA